MKNVHERLTAKPHLDNMSPMGTFQNWCDSRSHGVLRALSDATGLSYSTIRRIYAGAPASPKAARLLSAATGGEVSVDSLRGITP